ncbi:MAG TPA: DUF58 domain-containing protein [Methylomirabilota bacterium]
MTMRLTPLALSVVTLGAWGLVLGVLSGRAELAVVVMPLLLGLLRIGRARAHRDWSLRRALSATRVLEGERVTVTVTVSAAAPVPLIELLDPLPPSLRLVAGHNRGLFTLDRGRPIEWHYQVECVRRGRVSLGAVQASLWSRAGLEAAATSAAAPAEIRVYPRPLPLRRLPSPRRMQAFVGNYVAPSVGEGLEPGDIRAFAPGDRVRHVNWRASLRFRELFVTRYHQERNADIVLMLDTLAEAGTPSATTLDASIRAAAALATGYLARKDRVGLIEYCGPFRWVRPGSGRAHQERLFEALLGADVMFSYVTQEVALVPRRILPPQALVIAISPLLDARFEKALVDLAARGFDLVVLSPSPIPLVRAAMRQSAAADLACRLWALERQAHAAALQRLGIAIVDWNPDQPLEAALGVSRASRRRAVER